MSKYANVDHGEIADDDTGIEVGMPEVCVEASALRSHFERAGV
jgi:hypothetical protein